MKYRANPIEVEAHRIRAIDPKNEDGSLPLQLDTGEYVASAEQLARITPAIGDYVVRQSDGYVYLNPAAVFELKYSPADPYTTSFENAMRLLRKLLEERAYEIVGIAAAIPVRAKDDDGRWKNAYLTELKPRSAIREAFQLLFRDAQIHRILRPRDQPAAPLIVPPATRDAMEVQRAHDALNNIITGTVDIGEIPPLDRNLLRASLEVLCWVLQHDHNTAFAEHLKELRDAIREAGYEERKADAPFTLDDLERRPN